MILSELNNLLINVARSNYLVQEAFVGDVYTINSKENKFGCFVATPMTGVKMALGTIRYRYVLYYIDRLTKKEDNIDFVQSDAVSVLKGIIDFFQEYGIEVVEGYEFTLFRQKFSDWCAGAYLNVSFVVPDNDCGEGDFNTEGIDLKPLVVDQNGIYEPGFNAGYNHVTVNVPQQGATQEWVLSQISSALSGFQATSESLGGVIVGPGLQVSDNVLTPKVGDAMDTLLCINEGGYLAVDLMWFYSGVTGIVNNEGYAQKSWISDHFLGSDALTGYATQSWVENQGYLTSVPSEYATKNWVGNQGFLTSVPSEYATKNWVGNQGYITSVPSEYATKSWVGNQGYLTSVPSGYATQSWVENNFVSSTALTGYATQSWVESTFISASAMDDYLLKTYTSGSVSMMFGPELPYIYLQSSAGNLNARVNLITMRNTSSYFTQQTPFGYTTQYSSQRAGIWYDEDYSSAILGVRDGDLGLAIDTRNIYLTDNYSSSVIPISDLATQSWVSSNYFEESKIWTGNQSAWEQLTSEQQAAYTIALITE